MLGSRLERCRKELNMTKKEVAGLLNIDQSTYGKYELGKREPGAEMLQKLADIYGTSVDYLLGRTDNPQHKIVPKEELPLELAKYVDYIEILKDCSVEDISPEELREVIEFAKKIKNKA